MHGGDIAELPHQERERNVYRDEDERDEPPGAPLRRATRLCRAHRLHVVKIRVQDYPRPRFDASTTSYTRQMRSMIEHALYIFSARSLISPPKASRSEGDDRSRNKALDSSLVSCACTSSPARPSSNTS